MTKKFKSSKSNENESRPFRFQSLHERLNNININVVHRIRYHDDLPSLERHDDLIRSSHFHHSLEHWSTLNFSEVYSKLQANLRPLTGSLEQVVHNREQVLSLLRQSFIEQNPLILETLLDLVVQLARDLQSDFYVHYKEYLFVDIINLLINSRTKQQNEMNTQLLEQVFQCLTYLFKYLWRIMLKDLANLYELYSKYLFSSVSSTSNTEYIRSFAAESFAYLLRKIENYQPFIDYLYNRNETSEDELESLALVFAETCQNVQSTFHSCTKTLLTSLLKTFLTKPHLLRSSIQTIYRLLIEHTDQQNISIPWNCFFEVYRSIDHRQSVDCLIYQTFYEIFQLFIEKKMITDMATCRDFLTIVEENSDEEFLKVHYQTVWKLLKYFPNNHEDFIPIYYKFLPQTSVDLLFDQMKSHLQDKLYDKLPKAFSRRFWDYLFKNLTKEEDIVEYLVEFLLIQRKKFQMIIYSNDTDEIILEKIDLLKTKNRFLNQDNIPEPMFEFLQVFLQKTLANFNQTENLVDGRVWKALLLLHSIANPRFSITNDHLEKLSSHLIQHSFESNSMVSLTLFELITHSHSFPPSFWYSLLEKQPSLEILLLCTRISLLLSKPTDQNDFERFVNLLKENLSSFNPNIRLLTLYILCAYQTDSNHPLINCLRCEQSPLNVYEYRSKIIHLQKLSVDFLSLNKYSASFHLSMRYLLGLLATNFTPLWAITIELLGSYGNKAIESIGHQSFWSIFNEKFQSIKQQHSVVSNELIDKYFENEKDESINAEIDSIQYRINLFQILSLFPNECENKTKLLFPIIFDFFANEYYDHLLALGLVGLNQSSYQIQQISSQRLTKKSSLKTLESILKLLKQFHHPKQWFEPERLYQFYKRLLLSTDNSIQQLAYECLLTCTQLAQAEIHTDFLSHSENLMPIFNPSTTRKTFHDLIQGVLLDSNLSDSIRSQYAFVLIRIIYSKLNGKRSLGSTTRGRKDYLELNRKYLFQFLITFASNELYHSAFHFFIQLLLEPFRQELFSSSNSEQYLQIFDQKIQSDSSSDFHLNSYEIFLKYIQHSLLLLKTFTSKLRIYVQQEIDSLIKFYLLTIKFVDYLSRQNQPSNENDKSVRVLLKRLRSMSYKGLQSLFELFDSDEQYQFNRQLIEEIWLCSIQQTYLNDLMNKTKQREDLVHLLKLTIIWSQTKILKKQFLDHRDETKDLMKCFVDLLNENTTNQNKQLIVEFIWNILQIDPDDSLIIPYYDQLLSYLTKISSSMIETTNSIALSPKEFDILLILSQKQFSIEKIEQLCSIFIRLLRQNILGKKKKKKTKKTSNEQNFNVSVLKILQNLTKNLQNPIEKYLHLLTIFCAKITQRDQRIEFIQLIQIFLDQATDTTSTKFFFLKQLIELNSWNHDQVDEPDYERRLNAYKQLTQQMSNLTASDHDTPEYLCIFNHCLYELHNSINDLSLREYSSQVIDLFLQRIPSYEKSLLSEIRSLLKQSTANRDIRYEFVRHLISLVDRNSDNENIELIDLKRLRNYQDVEIDFFHNVTHVQFHRRLRALKRLKAIHSEQEFHPSTIKTYLLPIICSFINDVLTEQIDDIQDEIVFQCLTIFSQKLPWVQYNQLLISYFRQLTSTKKVFNLTQKRCLTKTISAIIDAFHFQADNQAENERIRKTIQKHLFPMILKLLSENSFSIESLTNSSQGTKNASIDDQRQQAILLTVTCSLIATKLLVIFPHEFIEQHISTIILHLITLLRSRIYSIRDQARDCLCKCLTTLGKRYLKFIIQELIAGLQRGYQHFVLLHTVHYILIHISELTVEFNIDSSVEVIVNLFAEDFFNLEKTESSKANEHENSSYKPSNIPEAKTNKTANVFEILGKLIHSNEQLFHCIEPLRQQLSSNSDSRQISKCEKCLQRFQTGLILNSNLSLEVLFSFIYHLLTKTEEKISGEQSQSNKPSNRMAMIVEERQKYHLVPSEPKRGHARLAQAIKYMKKTNIHCLIAWTLNLLHKLIKKSKNENEQFLSMIDPFIEHIEICLNSQYTDVIVSSLRNLSSIIEYSLPSLTKEKITNIYKKVFDLLKIYSAAAGSNDLNDLLTLSYKILGLFVQRSISDNVQLSSDEYQCLFTYIESDLLNVHRQSSAYLLLRSIMRHSSSIISSDKTLRTQLDDLLRSRLIFLIIQSPFDHIRSTCRDLFHLYLFSYEHTKAKLKSYFDFFLLQLDYEDFNGRLSVLVFLQNLFQDLTKQRLNDYAAYFFLPLACHFYNETNAECKKQFQNDLKLLLEKVDQQHRNDILKNIVFSWFDDQIEHRCLALQLFVFFIEIEQEQFDQYLNEIFDFMEKEFSNIQQNETDDDEQDKFNDQYIYHLINVLISVIKYCPNSLQNLQLRFKWLNLLKIIDEKCLLHPHLWVRFLSAQLFGLLFEKQKPDEIAQRLKNYQTDQENSKPIIHENGSSRKRMKKSSLDQEPLFVHYVISSDLTTSPLKKIQRLCLCACAQLKPSNPSEEFSLQIIKNLIHLSKILLFAHSNEIDLVVRRCCRLTTFESTKYPNEISRRSAILKWMAGVILDLSSLLTDHYKSFLTVIEREIERDETTSSLPLKVLAQDVFDVFKRHGDIHLITSIYAEIAKQRRSKRSERKQKLAILAINQPEVAYRKKRVKQTKRVGLGKKKRMKAIEKAKVNRKKKVMNKTSDDIDDF